MKAAHQAELEHLRQTLSGVVQRQNLEHQVAFSRQHEKRASVIEELHKKAFELEKNAQRYTSSLGSEPAESYADIGRQAVEFRDYAIEQEIHLDDRIMTAVLQFSQDVWEQVVQTGVYSDFGKATNDEKRRFADKLIGAMERVAGGGLRRRLIVEFRYILGTLPEEKERPET